jgi:hypothetical protein
VLGTAQPQHPTVGSYRLIHADKGVGLWLKHIDKLKRQKPAVVEETEEETETLYA